jgi:hypothetical protein
VVRPKLLRNDPGVRLIGINACPGKRASADPTTIWRIKSRPRMP